MRNPNVFSVTKGTLTKRNSAKLLLDNTGNNLSKAVKLSQNETFCIRINAAVNPTDAHAIDVMNRRKCWALHVTNVLRKEKMIEDGDEIESSIVHTTSLIDFIDALSEALAG